MKKLILFSVAVVIYIGIQLLMNCSRPLESINGVEQVPPETVTVIDTITLDDTMFCAKLNFYRKEIVWMFHNQEGLFRLEFVAAPEREHSSQTLLIDIDERQFLWHLADSLEFIIEQDLEQDATIRITSVPPHAYGRAIDICLSVRAS